MSTAESKTVTLGEKSYDVPPVAFCNAAKIVPLVDKTFLAMRENRLEEEQILNLGRIVYAGIAKPSMSDGSPMSEADFLAQTIGLQEMIAAAVVVASQANMRPVTPGEATAA